MAYKSRIKSIEILIILLPLILIFTQTTVNASFPNYKDTKLSISFYEEKINSFIKDVGRLPTSEEGLIVLIYNHNNIKGWNGPYSNKKFVEKDWWGNDYIYICPSKYGNKEYDLYSFGVDAQNNFGEKDDITNWSKINYDYYDKFNSLKTILRFSVKTILVVLLIFLLYTFTWNLKLWCYCLKLNNKNAYITKDPEFHLNVLNPLKWLQYIFNESDNENNKIIRNKTQIKFGLKITIYLFIGFILNCITLYLICNPI